MTRDEPTAVGVFPRKEHARRPRLFRAVEEVFGVRFEPREPGDWDGVEAGLVFAEADTKLEEEAERAGVPYLLVLADVAAEDTERQPFRVQFTGSRVLDPRLRNRATEERSAFFGPTDRQPLGDEVLAHSGGRSLWTGRGSADHRSHVAALALPELEEGATLRDLLRSGRFLQLLPLVHFLRELTGYWDWTRPQTRASFLFDDPNLHWPSYGHLRFAELADHAKTHRYHVGMATIPLDAWFIHPKAARIFRSSPDHLSLVVHGNDHLYRELAPSDNVDELALAVQALRRIAALERRIGVQVGRVMVPPHGRYTERMLATLVRAGFEAFCGHFPPTWWHDASDPERLPGAFRMAELAPAGLPIIKRYNFVHPHPPEEFLFWSFLDRPIVLYGHHADLAEGMDVLAREAEAVNDLGEVAWMSLQSIARSNFMSRLEDDVLRVRMFSRQIELSLPSSVRGVVVEIPFSYDGLGDEELLLMETRTSFRKAALGYLSDVIPTEGSKNAVLTLNRPPAIDLAEVQLPPRRLTPVVRRAVGESRDRARPLIRRARLEPLLRKLEHDYEAMKARRRGT